MSDHTFRDRDRAVRVLSSILGDYAKAERVIDALVVAGVELPHPVRQFARQHMPNGAAGFVIEDIDWPIHAVRVFGSRFGTDDTGWVRLVELKQGEPRTLGESKSRTLGLLDALCRRGDGTQGRYWGCATVHFVPNLQGRLVRVWIDGREVTKRQFCAWLAFDETWWED